MAPVFSVIIPCYNHGKLLRGAVESVIALKANDLLNFEALNQPEETAEVETEAAPAPVAKKSADEDAAEEKAAKPKKAAKKKAEPAEGEAAVEKPKKAPAKKKKTEE